RADQDDPDDAAVAGPGSVVQDLVGAGRVAGEDDAAVPAPAREGDHRPDVLTLCLKRSKAAPARWPPRPAAASWPRLLSLKTATPASFKRAESSRVSGWPEENTEPRPCTHTTAVRRRPRGSATTPSSQTPSRVAMRTREAGTPIDRGITGHWPHPARGARANGGAARSPV